MEPLLLLSLFIAHLAVGGELLQYSTGVIYVSDNGKDDSTCLDGGSRCKTLGYVLTNIPMLQCSNCTVNVTYDHIVGPPNSSTPHTVNINSVEVLRIVGLGQPSLYFNGSGLLLVNNDNTTSVIIENVTFNDCNGDDACIRTLDTFGNYYFLLNFTVTNVVLHNTSSINVVAQRMYWQHSNIYDSSYGGLDIYTPDVAGSEIVVLNSTFQSIISFSVVDITLRSGHVHQSNVSIIQCQFVNASNTLVSLTNELNCFVNFVVDECMFYNNTGKSMISIQAQRYVTGMIFIMNNTFTKSRFTSCISAKFSDSSTDICQNNVTMSCTRNTFTDNICTGDIVSLEKWAYFEINDSVFINNVVYHSAVFIKYDSDDITCFLSLINVTLSHLLFINNNITTFPTTADNGAIITLQKEDISSTHIKISLSNLNFTSNTGTPLSLDWRGTINITGYMLFIGNNAITGGGMYIRSDCVLAIADNATVSFINNTALDGGAIYVDQDRCFVSENYDNGSIIFSRNHANRRPLIYAAYNWCSSSNAGCIAIQDTTSIASPPTNILFNIDNKTSVYPGQTIVGDTTITDCFGNASSCLAGVYLLCGGRICDSYYLQGPSTILLSNGAVSTGLSITTVSEFHDVLDNPQIQFSCKLPIATKQLPIVVSIDITVLPCPLGFIFNPSIGVCECAVNDQSHFICNRDVGVACIREDYWYGNFTNGIVIISKCVNLFCNYSRAICPSIVSSDSASYVLLDSSQCIDGHGGTLCTGCAHKKLPTYGALQCIDSDKCAKWHPYILLLLNIVIPFIDGVVLIAVVRLKMGIGSGYLYGPLFYLAVLNLMPITSYGILGTIISSFVATLLLQFRILGYIPWCFFDTVSLLNSKWFELIAPSVVTVVLSLTVYLASCSPKLLRYIQRSPLQAMCLLILVLFWSLASAAISVITPVYLSGVKGARVLLQPDLPYLSGYHIPLWIVSVIILLVLCSVVFVLTFSRFLNLHRFKPVFDEFQSCYKDSYRWYGGIYFILWTIFQILAIASCYQLFQTLIIALAISHCLLQPYCKKWLNIMDGVLLGCLSVTSCFVLEDTSPFFSTNEVLTKVLVYMSVMLPLCLISLGIVCIVLVRFGLMAKIREIANKCSAINWRQKLFKSKKDCNVPQQQGLNIVTSSLTVNAGGSANDREPLIRYLQNSTDYSATDNDY